MASKAPESTRRTASWRNVWEAAWHLPIRAPVSRGEVCDGEMGTDIRRTPHMKMLMERYLALGDLSMSRFDGIALMSQPK
jgi:hypothetical protein